MACKFDYIENSALSKAEKEQKTLEHQLLAKQLIEVKLTDWSNEKLTVYPSRKEEFDDFVQYTLGATDKISTSPVYNKNQKLIAYRVRVNVLNGESTEEFDLDKGFYQGMFNTDVFQSISNEFEDQVEEHETVFDNIFDKVVQKLKNYKRNFKSLADSYQIGMKIKDIDKVVINLTADEFKMKMKGLSSYIVGSVNQIDYLSKKFFGTKDGKFKSIRERLNNLPIDEKDRKLELHSIASLLNQGKEYYHLFDELETIKQELKKLPEYKDLNPRSIDNYNREKLSNFLDTIFIEYNLSEEAKQSVLDNLVVKNQEGTYEGYLDSSSKLYQAIKTRTNVDTSTLFEKIEEGLKSSELKTGSLFSKLLKALNKRQDLQVQFNDLYLDVATKTLYPEYLKAFTTDEFKLTEEQFRSLLQNADEDSSFLSSWLGAAVDSSDQLLAFISTYLKRNLNDLHLYKTKNNEALIDVIKETGFDKLSKEEQQKSFDKMMLKTKTLKTDRFDALIQLTEDEVADLLPDDYVALNLFGKTTYYATQPDEVIYSEFDNIRYNIESRIFHHELQANVHDIVQRMNLYPNISAEDFVAQLKDLLPNVENIERFFTTRDKKKLVLNQEIQESLKDYKYSAIRNSIKAVLQMEFYKTRLILKPNQEIQKLQKELNLDTIDWTKENKDLKAKKEFQKNIKEQEVRKYSEATTSLGFVLKNQFDRVFGRNVQYEIEGDNRITTKEILLKDVEGNKKWVEVSLVETPETRYVNFSESVIDSLNYYTYSGEFQTFTDSYKNPKLNLNSNEKKVFDKIKSLIREGRRMFGQNASITPYIFYTEQKSFIEKLKENPKETLANSFDLSPEEDSYPLMKNGKYVDAEGNEVTNPVYVSKKEYDLNNKELHLVQPKYNNYVPVASRNRNLIDVALLYNNAAKTYAQQQELLPQINLIKTLIEGDEKASISSEQGILGRKTTKRNLLGKLMYGKQGQQQLVPATKLNEQLQNMINQLFYLEEEKDTIIDLGVTQISANKLANKLSGFNNLQVMMWNVASMLPNFSIAAVQMRSEAVLGEFFNTTDYNKAFKNVFSKEGLPRFFSDITKTTIRDKSKYAQLAVRYNAIQGEAMDSSGVVHKEDLAKKIFSNAAFFNQNAIEFLNQVLTMEMAMRGFMLPTGNSLWDAIDKNWKEGEPIRYDDSITSQIPNFNELELDFMSRLQALNRRLHGAYAKEDKNELQRLWYGRLMMMYKKYLYPSFKSRFGEQKHSFELRTTQEGYFRTYFKELFKELKGATENKAIYEGLIETGWKKSLKTVGKGLLKTNLTALDNATFKLASKNIKSVDDFLYGETLDERKRRAIKRAAWEMGTFLQFLIIAKVLGVIVDNYWDDDEESVGKKMLQVLEVNAYRMQNDLGIYLPFVYIPGLNEGIPAGITIDQLYRTFRDPFSSVRMIDNTTGFFRQLTGIEWQEDGVNFTFNDLYEREGYGYEKGDSKLLVKGYKTFLSPYWQMLKFMSPEEQLRYMNLMFKNSK